MGKIIITAAESQLPGGSSPVTAGGSEHTRVFDVLHRALLCCPFPDVSPAVNFSTARPKDITGTGGRRLRDSFFFFSYFSLK